MVNQVPDKQITGVVTKFNFEQNPDGSAVLVAYTRDHNEMVGKVWITFDPDSVRALRRAVETRLAQ
ncbi:MULTISPECIES: hypothetical protein [unclassified Streptomyces]|uniref:hypothetical protein n=1 Tax=unclassified Streptomyces TaxID=2593676 RepID=UPI00381D2F84